MRGSPGALLGCQDAVGVDQALEAVQKGGPGWSRRS